jgi:hypothetical protein
MIAPASNPARALPSPYRIIIHDSGGAPDQVITIDKLREAILTSLASKQSKDIRSKTSVSQIHQRIFGELVRQRVSKFGFDGRRITLKEIQAEVS